jgi:hypothetical protein
MNSTKGHTANGAQTKGVHRIPDLAAPSEPSATATAEAPKPAAPESPKTAAAGRDASGKFTPGNRLGQGNPHARRMAALRQAFLSVATEQRLKELGEKLYAAAVGGDWQAAKLFLLFVVGRPADAVNPDTLDLAEFQLLASAPSKGRMMLELIDSLPPGAAAELLGRARANIPDADAAVNVLKRESPEGPHVGCSSEVLTQERKAKRVRSR